MAHAWKGERQKVHSAMHKSTVMDNSLAVGSEGGDPITWRLDLKTAAKNVPAEKLNQPTAIVQLKLKGPADGSVSSCNLVGVRHCIPPLIFSLSLLFIQPGVAAPGKTVQFEMSKAQVQDVMSQISSIKDRLSDFDA